MLSLLSITRITALLLVLSFTLACAAGRETKKSPQRVLAGSGEFIPGYGFSIDAAYDPRLDGLVEGYKLVTVVIRNTSLHVIQTDPKRDRWRIVDREGRARRAVNSLKLKNRELWRTLPEGLRKLIDYPENVPISYTVTFDLLFPKRVVLQEFQEIRYRNAAWGQEFRIAKEP